MLPSTHHSADWIRRPSRKAMPLVPMRSTFLLSAALGLSALAHASVVVLAARQVLRVPPAPVREIAVDTEPMALPEVTQWPQGMSAPPTQSEVRKSRTHVPNASRTIPGARPEASAESTPGSGMAAPNLPGALAAPPRFVLPSAAALQGRAPTSSKIGGTVDPQPGSVVFPEARVSRRASLLASRPTPYPPGGRDAEVEADVVLELVVDVSGQVREARPLTRQGYGFEDAAVRAVLGYRFTPALLDGRPVSVRMRWVLQFRLR
jgi:protein TonB